MGQVVSNLFGSECNEVEKTERSSDPNLQTSQLIAPPSLVSCIGSRADGAINQFKVHDSGIQDVRDKRQVYHPTRCDSCSDLSTYKALQQDQLIATPTVIPSINSSTSKEALHQDLIIAPSTRIPSIGASTNLVLQHDLASVPSTLVSSIGPSTNEPLLLADLVDSIILSLNNEIKTYQRVEDLKRKERREEEERRKERREEEERRKEEPREEEKRRKAPRKSMLRSGGKERKIKHYSSAQKILLVGEGDFSFSACLAMVFGSASNMVATSLDSKEFLSTNYKKAMSNIGILRNRGCKVMHGVDATEMANNCLINGFIFDRIIYNFPLAGFFKGASRKSQLKQNRKLVLMFLDNAKQLMSENGEIHITHKSCGFFLEWNLQHLASQVGLRLIEEVPFNLKDYEGYNNKYGFGGDDNFNCKPSKTYKFGLKLQKHS